MDYRQPDLPSQRNYDYAYTLAANVALKKLGVIRDLKLLAEKAGAHIKPGRTDTLNLNYLNQNFEISWPGITITPELSPRDRLLIMHYLVQVNGLHSQDLTTGRLVSYQGLPPGLVYMPVFMKRAIKPVISHFGHNPGLLTQTGKLLGCKKADYGDESITIIALPRVEVTFLLWYGDEEFSPAGNILFDESILSYLPAEDITIISEIVAWKLVKRSI